MTSGNNTTTVSINKRANEVLDMLAVYHKLSKVDIISALVLGLAALDQDQVYGLISGGHITAILLKLGAKIDYPNGIILKDTYAPLPLLRIITQEEDK